MGTDRLTHLPALDGLRGAAVVAVIAFHAGWLSGGFLGVDLFFTLSGYLITSLLLRERQQTGTIRLGSFWARRARRLFPALLAVVATVAVYAAVLARPDELASIRADGLATLFYVANWRALVGGGGYWEGFTVASPFEHAWSLAIEEQFYVVWPLVVVALLAGGRRRRAVGLAAAVGVALSFGAAMVLLSRGASTDRVYLGTDTRVGSILVGALLAVVLAERHGVPAAGRGRTIGPWAAAAAAAALIASWTMVTGPDLLARGGFGLHALLVAVVLAAVARRSAGPVGRVLETRTLVWFGTISYGLYLWHWPVFVALSPERTGLDDLPLDVVRIAVSLAVAVASYHLIEQPFRRGSVPRWALRPMMPASIVGVVALLVVATPPAQANNEVALPVMAGPDVLPAPAPDPTTTTTTSPSGPSVTSPPPTTAPARPRLGGLEVRPATAADPLRVVLVGDSVMADATPAVLAVLGATGAVAPVDGTVRGFSLGNDDWRTRWPELVATTSPEVVVGLWGLWDEVAIERFGEAEYRQRLTEALAVLRSGGAAVVLYGVPASRRAPDDPRPNGRAANRFFREAAATIPGITYRDADPILAPTGESQRTLVIAGTEVVVRKHDGTHLCPAGAALLALDIVNVLAPVSALPAPAVGWEVGAWRNDPVYDEPPGACG